MCLCVYAEDNNKQCGTTHQPGVRQEESNKARRPSAPRLTSPSLLCERSKNTVHPKLRSVKEVIVLGRSWEMVPYMKAFESDLHHYPSPTPPFTDMLLGKKNALPATATRPADGEYIHFLPSSGSEYTDSLRPPRHLEVPQGRTDTWFWSPLFGIAMFWE